MTSSCSYCLWKFLNNQVLLIVLFVISVITCILIESDSGFILCKSKTLANTSNKILLAISYGYISSLIFHFFVNVSPKKYQKYLMKDWVSNMLFTIREDLRLSKNIVINQFSFNDEPKDRDSYVEKFVRFNFIEENSLLSR